MQDKGPWLLTRYRLKEGSGLLPTGMVAVVSLEETGAQSPLYKR